MRALASVQKPPAERARRWPFADPWLEINDVLITTGLAALVTALPIFLHLLDQALAIAAAIMLCLSAASLRPKSIPAIIVFSYLFQNSFVALVADWVDLGQDFNAIRGYNFVTTATIWLLLSVSCWKSQKRFDAQTGSLLLLTSLALAFIGAFACIGMLSSPASAAASLRNTATPFMLFQIFLLLGLRFETGLDTAIALFAALIIGDGYFELLLRDLWMTTFNAHEYWRHLFYGENIWAIIKEHWRDGQEWHDLSDQYVTDFFNTPLLADLKLRMVRLVGPNFHPVAFAYALSVLSAYLIGKGRWAYALLSLPLLMSIGSKGATTLLVFCVLGLMVSRRTKSFFVFVGAILLLSAYAVGAATLGLESGDNYHALGLLGGLKGFLGNLVGHGLGTGGNLDSARQIDWDRAQAVGSTDTAVESAIGVLLFQMGVFGILVLSVLVLLAGAAWREFRRSGDAVLAVLAFAILCLVGNGALQEEALFSPLAMGLTLALTGAAIGKRVRLRTPAPSNVSS